jgi:hypothetical protein
VKNLFIAVSMMVMVACGGQVVEFPLDGGPSGAVPPEVDSGADAGADTGTDAGTDSSDSGTKVVNPPVVVDSCSTITCKVACLKDYQRDVVSCTDSYDTCMTTSVCVDASAQVCFSNVNACISDAEEDRTDCSSRCL